MDSFLPYKYPVPNDILAKIVAECKILCNSPAYDRICWAIDSFSSYKYPEPDVFWPRMLQSAKYHVIPWLMRIFAYLQISFQEIGDKVVFIPNNGK